MNLLISQSDTKSLNIRLFEGTKAVDTVDFSFDKNLDTLLIASIDKLLKRNKIDVRSIVKVKVAGGVDKDSSLYKIVQTWLTTVKIAKKYS